MADLAIAIKLSAVDAASPVLGKVTKEVAGIGTAAEQSSSKVGGLTSVLGKIGLASIGIAGITTAVAGLGKSLVDPIMAASDLDESMNKVGVVFGDSATLVTDFARRAATSLGQSQSEALAAAGTFGNLFTSMGLGQKDAAKLSTEIVGLGSDLASFNNIKPEEALEKLRSGLIGESEPLRSLGVNLNEAAVQAEALRLGLAKDKDSITDAAKIQARYSLILQQTKNAQGDFGRTSTGMANSLRIINASFADLQTTIGSRLLPVVAPLVSRFAQELPRALDAVGPVLDRIGAGITTVVGTFTQFSTGVQGLVGTLRGGDLVGVLTTIRAGILEQAGTWGQAFLDWASAVVPPLLEKLGVLGSKVVDWAIATAPSLIEAFGGWALAGLGWAIEATKKVLPVLGDFALRVIDWVGDNAPRLVESFVGEWVPAAVIWVGKAAIKLAPELVKLGFAVQDWVTTKGVPALITLGGKLGVALIRGLVTGVGTLASALGPAIAAELRQIRVDVGPFHLSAAGFTVDTPTIPAPRLPWQTGDQPGPSSLPVVPAVPAFQHGGVFRVGGAGGPDSRLVAFRATPGEIVAVGMHRPGRTPPQGGPVTMTVNFGSVVVREEADIDKIADRVEQYMTRGLRSARSSGQRFPLGVSGGA